MSTSSDSVFNIGYDVVVVYGYDKGYGCFSSTEFLVSFNKNTSIFKGMFKKEDQCSMQDASENVRSSRKYVRPYHISVKCNGDICDSIPAVMLNDRLVFDWTDGVYKTTPSSTMLEQLGLKWGKNIVSFECRGYQCEVSCVVWLWTVCDRLAVVDVDGTLTRSDVRGYVETVYLGVYDYIHTGVVEFLNNMVTVGSVLTEVDSPVNIPLADAKSRLGKEMVSNLRVVYLTARPLKHLAESKRFIASVMENEQLLPSGPLLCNKVGRLQALYGEMTGSTADFKGQILQDIEEQFIRVGRTGESPWVLGIGNKHTDLKAYQMCNIRLENIFIVQKSSAIVCNVLLPASTRDEQREVLDDNSVLGLLERHGTAAQQGSGLTSISKPVGVAIAQNTLATFNSSDSSNFVIRRQAIDWNGSDILVEDCNTSGVSEFLPGDNAGWIVGGETVAVQSGGSWLRQSHTPYAFTGYADPILLDYVQHLLRIHHDSSQCDARKKDVPFRFPRPRGGDVDGSHNFDCPNNVPRKRSLSNGDTSTLPAYQDEFAGDFYQRSEPDLEASSAKSCITPCAQHGSIVPASTTRKSKVLPCSLSSDNKKIMNTIPESSRGRSRVNSEPSPPSDLHSCTAGPLPIPEKPLRGKSTAKGVKLSQMTDYFNSDYFADV